MTFQVFPVPGRGAEDVTVAVSGPDEGAVFTGTEDGVIHRVSHDGRRVEPVAQTGGRPLGIEYLPDGRLLVCDAHRGVLEVDPRSGRVETLVADIDGRPMRFCNNAAVAADGTVYFSDSSTVHGIAEWKADLVELTRTGRLVRRSTDGRIEVLVEGLAFANGVALALDESYVAVAETAARNIVRYWLTGPRAGTRDVFATDLPGYPDNIARGSDGLIWVSIASPRDPVVELLQRGPLWVRRQVTRIPDALQPAPKRTVRVQAFDDQGTVVHDLQPDDAEHRGRYHMVTGVREHDGRVWMGSLHEPAVAVLDLRDQDL
jgi:sugar lactone lactonase YvrE